MPSIYSSISSKGCGGGASVDLDKYIYSENPLGSVQGALIQRSNVVADTRGMELSTWNVSDLENFDQRITTNSDDILQLDAQLQDLSQEVTTEFATVATEQGVQDGRLDALEAQPSLPTATTLGEYLYYDSTSTPAAWTVGGDQVTIGTNSGLGATLLRKNVILGPDNGALGSTFDLSTIIGQSVAKGTISGDSHVVIGNNTANDICGGNTVNIGSLTNHCNGNNVCVGYRLGFNSGDSSSYQIGSGSVVLGANVYVPVSAGSIVINGSNVGFTDTVSLGDINLKAFSSQFKLQNVNIEATQQASGRHSLVSTDGVNYAPADITRVYTGERAFFTHYTKPGDPVLTANIGITSAFNLLSATPRRFEYSPGGSLAVPPQWDITATNRMRWSGSSTIPVTVQVCVEVERVSNGLCLANLVPLLNGSETDIKIAGNLCDARIPRNSTTNLNLSFILDLNTNDELSFILKKTNGTATTLVRIRYVDVKIYSLRSDQLTETVILDL